MNDNASVADPKAKLGQILDHLNQAQAGLAAVKEALDGGAKVIRAASEGSHRNEAGEAVTALARSSSDTDGVLSEISSAIKEVQDYRNLI